MSVFDELLEANDEFAGQFTSGDLPAPPAKHMAVLTCMDARILPLGVFGLEPGDAHIIRNAGGRVTDDAIRSLLVSTHILGVRAIAVVHHTECGMGRFTGDELRAKIGVDMDYREILDPETSVRDDVEALCAIEAFPEGTEVHGFEYDVRTGRLRKIA